MHKIMEREEKRQQLKRRLKAKIKVAWCTLLSVRSVYLWLM